ncbi:benzoate/H(+) symporter BenE family transporter [Chitiniphilus eburneus]|uniref:Benzoate/H(+) symporter BenE family transporter n=1 Tax=Chitiniphilus eburneus TaxID=2571148 RepID=A0A4U0PDV2_9NEIS|nr:benzoate/H(+) symporter BenE family transporter [Chitiniphilus eburneus]TJZ65799.1 benzoate/H(+) symporter BenE family transporter [Chitiniphilus eburneus]
MRRINDFSLSAVVAGFVTVLVGFTSSAVIVFQAAQALGASPAQIASWMWALGLAMGVTCIGLSLRYRVPVVTAWSTPGAAMLVTSVAGVSMPEAIGAFILCGVLIAIAGASGWFERAMARIPVAIASAMLAGVLLRFGMAAFASLGTQLALVGAMLATYLLLRRLWPRYAIVAVLLVGVAVAAAQGQLHLGDVRWQLAVPVFTMPALSWQAVLSVALPLFLVTMASQNVPGVAVLKASGYHPPISPIIATTGVVATLLAPFGAFALNLAAITAAICMGPEAHEDPAKRYTAAIAAGVFYLIVGLFGATVAALFAAFPKELVLALAGLALINTIGNGLAAAVKDDAQREPALITFLVTASGVTLFGIGSAFWGLVAGALAFAVLGWRRVK